MKKKFISSLVIGEEVQMEPFLLKEIGCELDATNNIAVKICDSTGEITCAVSKQLCENVKLEECVGTVLTFSGVILPDGRKPILKVSEIKPATTFIPAEIMAGLSEEKIIEYINDINFLKTKIKNPRFRQLLECCLTEENLRRLGQLPATLKFYGRYNGGALAATDAVTRMVISATASYTTRGNGLTTVEPSWNCLISASLLFTFGRIKYYTAEAPYKKSQVGVALGYFPCLQSSIEEVIYKNNIPLLDEEKALLMNILNVSVSDRTEAESVSKEGPILRHMISLYAECDSIDWEISTHEDQSDSEKVYYSSKLKRYISKPSALAD